MGELLGVQMQARKIAKLAYDVGITDAKELVTAVAVCLAESQGFDRAYNNNLLALSKCVVNQKVRNPETMQLMTVLDPATGKVKLDDGTVENHPPESEVVVSRDTGLWEISIPAAQIGTQVEEDLYDRENNAAAMWALYKNRGWQPWAAYNSNVYLHDTYVRRAALAVQNYLAELLVIKAKAAGQTPGTRVPMVSLKELLKLYQ